MFQLHSLCLVVFQVSYRNEFLSLSFFTCRINCDNRRNNINNNNNSMWLLHKSSIYKDRDAETKRILHG